MYDAATSVHVVEPEKDLLCDLFAKVHGDTLVLMPFDETEQVLTEHLKHHAYMRAVGPLVPKMVEEGDDVGAPGVGLRW